MSTAFRLFGPFQTFTDQHGNLAVGGSLVFFASGSTTPQSVYADQGLTTSLGNIVPIGTDGRPNSGTGVVDVWGSGNYRVRLLDANGVQIGPDMDNIEIPGGTGATLPTPFVPNAILSNDGSLPQWLTTLLMPDPTGHSGSVLGTDGTNVIWQTLAALGIPAVNIAAGSYQIGKLLIQTGIGTVAASGTTVVNATISFPTPYASTPFAAAVPTNTGLNNSWVPPVMSTSIGTGGFTAVFDSNSGFPGLGQFTSPQNYAWVAIGMTP